MTDQAPGPAGAVRVKICGIRTVAAALAAAGAGADLLGFNFAPVSKRRVDLETAARAIAGVRESEAPETAPLVVGIFVNQPADEVARIAAECRLDYVQLSGGESAAYCRALGERTGLPLIKAVRLENPPENAPEHDSVDAPDDADPTAPYAGEPAVRLLLADAAGSWGGSGRSWDWRRAAGLAARRPLLLAGGLTPDNVAGAVAAVRPWGVDVASGVETAGQTDPQKVGAFVQRAKNATSTGS